MSRSGSFEPTAYTLDLNALRKCQVTITIGPSRDSSQTETITVDELWKRHPLFEPKTFESISNTFTASNQIIRIDSDDAAARLVWLVYRMWRDDQRPLDLLWCWYDSDMVSDDPMSADIFFLVQAGKVVHQRVSLVTSSRGSPVDYVAFFDSVLKNDPIWLNDERLEQARIASYYRDFYQTTDVGKLMILRSDEPPLYYFPEGRLSSLVHLRHTQAALGQIHDSLRWVLWLLVAILVVAFFKQCLP